MCAGAVLYALPTKSFSVYPAGRPVPKGATTWQIVDLAWDRIPSYYRQFIGMFGWLDTQVAADLHLDLDGAAGRHGADRADRRARGANASAWR